ncbi:hypothetical protein BD779DRAFT_1466603 [Infundibulicybe gibba]|nr:hypothetical protein BD779DRAFT_1466603 [Infundibulicybe gibba]
MLGTTPVIEAKWAIEKLGLSDIRLELILLRQRKSGDRKRVAVSRRCSYIVHIAIQKLQKRTVWVAVDPPDCKHFILSWTEVWLITSTSTSPHRPEARMEIKSNWSLPHSMSEVAMFTGSGSLTHEETKMGTEEKTWQGRQPHRGLKTMPLDNAEEMTGYLHDLEWVSPAVAVRELV